MKKLLPLIIMFVTLLAILIFAYKNNLFNKKPAGLEINSTPSSHVYLSGKDYGLTPFTSKGIKPGEYTIRLVPEGEGSTFPPYETKISLDSATTTVISRTFAASDSDSFGYVLELQEEPGNKSYLSVISDPDTGNLTIDGKPHGYTPASKLEYTPGSHEISLSSPGYKPQNVSVNTLTGYNLIAKIKLAGDTIVLASPSPLPSPSVEPSASPSSSVKPSAAPSASPRASASPKASASPLEKPYVIIEETGTGWLRVRKDPSSSGAELGKADVGTKLKYLGETTEDGWHKVEFEGDTGWVSGKYATLVK